MDDDELIRCVNADFPHLQLTKNDLEFPTSSMLRKYYMTLLEQVTRMSINQLCGLNEHQKKFLRSGFYDTTMESHIFSYNLCMAVKYIFNSTGITEFHFSDILFPHQTPKRSKVFMHTMYVFYVTCAEFDACFEEQDTVNGKQQQMMCLEKEIESLKSKIQLNKDTKIQYADRVKQIKNDLTVYHEKGEQYENRLKELQQKLDLEMSNCRVLEEQEVNLQNEFGKVDNGKKYYESLVVLDEGTILAHHANLRNKKEECLVELQKMENKRRDGLTTENQFDKVLKLQEILTSSLKEYVVIDNSDLDFKGLNLLLNKLKNDKQLLDSDEKSLMTNIKEKECTLPCRQKEIQGVETENDSIKCTWQEKLSRYRALIDSLKQSLSEASQRLQIEESGLQVTRNKILSMEQDVNTKEKLIVADVKEQEELAAEFKKNIGERLLKLKAKTEHCMASV